MYGGRSYNLRSPANNTAKRYNATGTFVQSTQQPQQMPQQAYPPAPQAWPQIQITPQQPNIVPIPKIETQEMSTVPSSTDGAESSSVDGSQKKWMKKGYRISLREKRRRQNKTLRRLITPKNALMVLNELSGGSQQECIVTPDGDSFTSNNVNRQYVAVLNMGGVEYSGKGSTKLIAKNMAAESVIRDMILKQMNTTPTADKTDSVPIPLISEEVDLEKDDKSFPMIQLASYALHKLFSEWQTEGYKVPLFGPAKEQPIPVTPTEVQPSPGKPKKTPTLPANPEIMHPCMLLSQMRGTVEYNLISQEGAPPNRQIFTIGINMDDKSFTGQATNKKEARKQAAKKACTELFGVVYPDEPMAVDNNSI